MRYRLLGQSGLRISEFGLGTMTFGEDAGCCPSKAEAMQIYEVFRSAGGNFFDTSDIYSPGASERLLGEFIRADRDAIVISTKYAYGLPSQDPNAAGTHRKHLLQSIEASLKRLGTDHVDLLWVNGWDFLTPEFEVMRALDDVVRAGKVLYVGIAHAPAWIVSRCNTLAELHGWTPFVGLEVIYNLIERSAERELLPMARALDLGVVTCSPLAEGVLTGKYRSGGTQRGRLDPGVYAKLTAPMLRIGDVVAEIAREIDVTPAQAALAWVRDKGSIPLLGVRTVEQLKENLNTLGVSLSTRQIQQLESVSAIDLGFPYNYFNDTKEVMFGGMYERIERHRDRGIGVTVRP